MIYLKNSFVCFTIFLIFQILIGCGGGSATKRIPFKEIAHEINDKSLIYVYHEGSSMYYARVQIDRTSVVLAKNMYYPFIVSPGEIEIKFGFKGEDIIKKEFSPGGTTYVKIKSVKKAFMGPQAEFNIVSSQIGSDEIKNCVRGVMLYGSVMNPESHEVVGIASNDKALIILHRKSNSLGESSIGGWNVGIYSNEGREMIGIAVDSCQSIKHEVEPGLVRLIKGNVAISETGKTAGAIVGIHTSSPGSEFTEIETGLHGKKLSQDFTAVAGKVYYIELDPSTGIFNFAGPDSINTECLYNYPKIIQQRNSDFIKDLKKNKKPTGISWSSIRNINQPILYSDIKHSGGVLDYLIADTIADSRDKKFKSALKTINVTSLVEKNYVKPLMYKLKTDHVPSIVLSYKDQNTEVKYVYKAEIRIFGITSKHDGVFPFIVSSKQPAAVASIKGIVEDSMTGKVLFQKPFNGISRLPENARSAKNLGEICRMKLDDAMGQAMSKFIRESYVSLQ